MPGDYWLSDNVFNREEIEKINSLVKKFGTFLLGVPTQKNFIFFSRSPWSPEKFVYTKKYGKNVHYL